jgi:hypothetical protein
VSEIRDFYVRKDAGSVALVGTPRSTVVIRP